MPVALRYGRKWGMVVYPRLFGRRRRRRVSYLGGLGLAGAATIGFTLAQGFTTEALAILLGGVVLLIMGFADDRSAAGGLPVTLRLVVETLVAAVVWLAGIKIEFFAIEWIDAILTIVFLVGITNAFNLLDNMDGVAGATAVAISAATFGLAAYSGQHLVATLAAALAGASLGFLRHNITKARIFLGNGGSLFLGFLVASTALKLRLDLDPPETGLAILALFAIPLSDTTLVSISRWMNGRALFTGGVDHISHRLVKMGTSQSVTVSLHTAVSLAAGMMVLLTITTARSVFLWSVFLLAGVAVIALLRVSVYEDGGVSAARRAVLTAAPLVLALIGAGVASAVIAKGDLVDAREQLDDARTSLTSVDLVSARGSLDQGEAHLTRARGRLDSPVTFAARLVPGLRGNLQVATSVASAGLEMVGAGRAGIELLSIFPSSGGQLTPPLVDGVVQVEELVKAREPARRLAAAVSRASDIVASSDGTVLLPEVRNARSQFIALLDDAREKAVIAEGATSILPKVLGAGGKRTWVIAAENIAELRGRGGFLGSFGFVSADQGALGLEGFKSASELPALDTTPRQELPEEYRNHYAALGGATAWANLGMSPHFPSGANLLLTKLQTVAGINAEGVISLDPVGLSYLLEALGPVNVEGLPEPISSANVVDWTLNRQYFHFAEDPEKRKRFLGEVTEAVWSRITSPVQVDAKRLAEAFGRAIRERHMVLYSRRPAEQKLFEDLNISGGVEQGRGDYLMIVGQNFGENKMDYYLTRRVTYRGEVNAKGELEALLRIAVKNNAAPGTIFPQEVGGERPALELAAGSARTSLAAFVPPRTVLERVSVDEAVTDDFEVKTELGKTLLGTTVVIGPGETRYIEFRYRVPDVMDGPDYRLTIQKQSTPIPDHLDVKVTVPSSAVIAFKEGFTRGAGLHWKGPLQQDMSLAASIEVPVRARLLVWVASILRKPVLQV